MKKVYLAIIALFFISLTPCVYQTARLADDAYGLVILATLDSDEMTFNPYNKNGSFINQRSAVWILKNFEYPYSRCSDRSKSMGLCSTSLIGWVGRSLNSHDPKSTKRGYELLEHFISRGEPVNQLSDGMAPIHEAILYRNTQYLKILLSAGADLSAKIDKPVTEYDGLDAIVFLDLLENKGKLDFSEIRAIIEQNRLNK